MIDDGYFSDDYYDGASHYITNFKYFIPKVDDVVGIKLPDGTIQYNGNDYYAEEEIDGELYEGDPINFNSVFFWQYAKNKGYTELEDGNYKTGGDISNIFTVGTFFVLELVITNIGSSLIFVLLVIIISLIRKDFFFNDSDLKWLKKKIKKREQLKEAEEAKKIRQAEEAGSKGEPLF